jgi:hypothetical protein
MLLAYFFMCSSFLIASCLFNCCFMPVQLGESLLGVGLKLGHLC